MESNGNEQQSCLSLGSLLVGCTQSCGWEDVWGCALFGAFLDLHPTAGRNAVGRCLRVPLIKATQSRWHFSLPYQCIAFFGSTKVKIGKQKRQKLPSELVKCFCHVTIRMEARMPVLRCVMQQPPFVNRILGFLRLGVLMMTRWDANFVCTLVGVLCCLGLCQNWRRAGSLLSISGWTGRPKK